MAQPALKKEAPPVHIPGRGRIYDSITDTIGDTPLVRLDRDATEENAGFDALERGDLVQLGAGERRGDGLRVGRSDAVRKLATGKLPE